MPNEFTQFPIPHRNVEGYKAVRYAPQTLTDAEKEQARVNIGAADENISAGVVSFDNSGTGLSSSNVQDAITESAHLGSNRNLLDNPWFTVNQRGVSTFATNTYGPDRWKSYGGTLTVNSDKTIKIPQGCSCYQILENPQELVGKTVTLSAMMQDGTVYSGTHVFAARTSFVLNEYMNLNVGASLNISCDSRSNNTVIKAVKLELGSVSTLANDVAPDYGEELAKCQRYFQRIGSGYVGSGYYDSTTKALIAVPFIVEMRSGAIGSIHLDGTTSIIVSTSNRSINSISFDEIDTKMARISCTVSSALTAGYGCLCKLSENSYVDFSADL